MKKLLMVVLSLFLINSSYALESAKLRMKISGPIKDNRYFLCVTNVGCVSILNGNRGKAYPLNTGSVNNIFTVNATNMRMYTQPLPSSCSVSLKGKETLTVTANLVEGPNKKVHLNNLRCTVG